MIKLGIIQEMRKQVKLIWEIMAMTQRRQKSYANVRRKELSFEEGDCVYLRVLPMKGVRRYRLREKLSPRYIQPY